MSKLSSFDKAKKANDELGRVICGTACIITRLADSQAGYEFLLLKRTGAHGAGTWAPPGGWVEAHEHPFETIKREVWEEVGLTLNHAKFFTYTFDQHPEGIENVCLWFYSRSWSGQSRAAYQDRVEDIRWVSWDTLPHPLFHAFSAKTEHLRERIPWVG